MLKGGKRPSLWLRNMQLASYSALIAVASLACTADPVAREQVYPPLTSNPSSNLKP